MEEEELNKQKKIEDKSNMKKKRRKQIKETGGEDRLLT